MTYLLLLPILLPVLTAAIAWLKPAKGTLIPLLILEAAAVAACACTAAGSFTAPCVPGMDFMLAADRIGLIFTVLFSVMFLLAGIFGFEYLHERLGTYYVFYCLTEAAMIGLCFAGNLLTFYLFYEAMTLLS